MSPRPASRPFRALLALGLLAGAAGAAAQTAAEGKAVFLKNCAACHQANGRGIPGAFPALAGNGFVRGRPADVVAVLLKGRGGMPDFSNVLGDQDIARVLSYVRSDWGNGAPPVTTDEVAALRRELKADGAGGESLSNQH